ncbi:MAG: hypothetical protein KDK70_17525 [Myxococcales bacterium]|nr:hypothetical protein [Myxococcales bacterium]
MSIERMIESDGVLVASWRNVVLNVGKGSPSADHIDTVRRLVDDLLSKYPDGIGMMLMVYNASLFPHADGRNRTNELFREVGPRLQGVAAVVEGTGFWASAVRSVITGFTLVSRTKFPLKTFGSVDDASAWLVPLLVPAVTRAEFSGVIRELNMARRELGAF